MARTVALTLFLMLAVAVVGGAAGAYGGHSAAPRWERAQYLGPHVSGRPGVFRFYPNQEIQDNRAELAELRAGLDRLQGLLPAVEDRAARQQIRAELTRWQAHLDREQQRLGVSASPTAAEAETRLNAMKGMRQCGVCHGTENIGRIPVQDPAYN